MIALDFAPGLHGHYLEFVANKYIFGVPTSSMDIFQSSGACHKINSDSVYQRAKVINRGHFSSFVESYPDQTEKVIFIKHNAYYDYALLVNVFYRAHPTAVSSDDFNIEEIKQLHKIMMFDSAMEDWQLRNNWFAKLDERHFELTERTLHTDLPRFDFDYGCFFDLNDFVQELQRLSEFVGLTLKFDHTLADLWQSFIDKNQGYQSFVKCNQILNKTLSNQAFDMDLNWQEQSYINYRLSRMFRIYDGKLFDNCPYPNNSLDLYQLILEHQKQFDTRF